MEPGATVPDFTATDQEGNEVALSQLVADGPVVLFFYPRALTPGCTKESCHFRDLQSEFADLGARPVGISDDPPEKQRRFDEAHSLGFTLLSDPDKDAAKALGAKRLGPLHNRRMTFVIDTDRTLLDAFKNEINMEAHADRALAVLRDR